MIVIAVIGILAAVLIPTFSNLITKANGANTFTFEGGYFNQDISEMGVLAVGYKCVRVDGIYKVVLDA